MTVLDKNDVLEGLFASWDSIAELLAGLSEDERRRRHSTTTLSCGVSILKCI